MKIIVDNAGQTCNKFWCYIPVLIDCIKKKEKCIILYYDAQIEFFPNLLYNDYFYYPTYSRFFNRILGIESYNWQIRKLFKNKMYNIYPYLLKEFKNTFEYSWDRRYEKIPNEFIPEIKRIFTPKKDIISDVMRNFSSYRSKDAIIVGVHIRRGDYKNFKGGDYYYSIKEYVEICKVVKSYFGDKKVIFFIASNEKIDSAEMEGLDYFCIECSSVVKDLYSLSLSDYIIGPPSSFSRWASFYGEVPIYFLMKAKIKQEDILFRKMISYGYYEDNEKVSFDF